MSKITNFIDRHGEWIGLSLITIVTFYDFVITGIRGFLEYSIGIVGMIVIWASLALIFTSKKLRYDSIKDLIK